MCVCRVLFIQKPSEVLCGFFVCMLFTAPSAAPQNPTSTTLNATAIQVQWEVVPEIDQNGIITFYEVQIDPAQFQDVSYVNVSEGSELVLVFDELEEFVEYNFTIRAYTSAGPGPFSDITTSRTDEAGEGNACGNVGKVVYCLRMFTALFFPLSKWCIFTCWSLLNK